jgi:hypothetical protein
MEGEGEVVLMKHMLPLILLLAVALAGAPALGAPITPKTAITGFPPYVLGENIETVLGADPELSTGVYPLWTTDLLTRNYGRSIVAPIGGVNYIGLVGLQFWRGRLAVVILQWPARAFQSVSAWRHAAAAVRNQIMMSYAPGAVKGHLAVSGQAWMIDLADTKGNVLSAWSLERPNEITTVYLWAPYARALETAPGPEGGY